MNLRKLIIRIVRSFRGKDTLLFPNLNIPNKTYGNPGAEWTISESNLTSKSVVYSIGIGTDISFDLALIENFAVEIYAYDPTEKSIQWLKKQNLPPNFHYFQIGLADYDGKASLFPPDNSNHISHTLLNTQYQNKSSYEIDVRTLKTLMESNNHDHIDLLKMDVEGIEYDVLENMLASGIEVKQLLVEFHHRFKNIGVEKTKTIVAKLLLSGYKIFAISESGEEYSFMKD